MSTLTTILYNFTEKTFELTSLESDCSDVGGQFLPNQAACKEAAKELGKTYLFPVNEAGSPRGCIMAFNVVKWNNHLTGAKSKSRKAVCSGRYQQR